MTLATCQCREFLKDTEKDRGLAFIKSKINNVNP